MSKKSGFCVGVTGGIGAGTTLICRIFEVLGIPVYYADQEARLLMQRDALLVQAITQLLGKESYQQDGSIDRSWVSGKIFSDGHLLQSLNHLVHPTVQRDAAKWHDQQASAYTLREAALIFEGGGYLQLDAVINVEAPVEVRLQRVMQRDHAGEKAVRRRMNAQWSEDQRRQLADFTIINDGSHQLVPQVWQIHRQLWLQGLN